MSSDDPVAVRAAAIVERTAGELAAQGFPRMPAYVLMTLTSAEESRLSAAELAERLGVSAAAISGAVRYLTTLGFVRRVAEAGSRRHVYALSETPWYTTSLSRPGLYAHIESLVRSSAESLPAGSTARERLTEMADFFAFFEERIPALLEEWKRERGRR